jgi:hypothetical protein
MLWWYTKFGSADLGAKQEYFAVILFSPGFMTGPDKNVHVVNAPFLPAGVAAAYD